MEGKEYNIIGGGRAGRLSARELAREKEFAARNPVEGEVEKTPREIKCIERANVYINDELKALELPVPAELASEEVHVLPEKVFEQNISFIGNDAVYDTGHGIFINKEKVGDANFFRTVLHEGLHKASYHKYCWYFSEKRQWDMVEPSRLGYTSFKSESDSGKHEHLRGFNEAVVEKTVQELIKKNRKDIIRSLNFNVAQILGFSRHYEKEMELVDFMVDKIAEKKGEGKEDVWGRFKKGLFTGEMMHLRDIERTFGKGALRMIASIQSVFQPALSDERIVDYVRQYLETENGEERKKIAELVLNLEERRQHEKRLK